MLSHERVTICDWVIDHYMMSARICTKRHQVGVNMRHARITAEMMVNLGEYGLYIGILIHEILC